MVNAGKSIVFAHPFDPQPLEAVKVGILHSLSGTMALSSAPLVKAALMAIAEINQSGGVLGRRIEPIVEDGASDPAVFAAKANRLIDQEQVLTIFGCWTSLSRKVVKEVVEARNVLLWYPMQYEGLECSPNIFYTGSCANQQVEPAVNWLLQRNRKRVFLIGSDYVFPRTLNRIIAGQLQQQGGTVAGEAYLPLGGQDFSKILQQIVYLQPEAICSTLNGESGLYFYPQFQAAGFTPAQIPIMALSMGENEFQAIGAAAIGHYASWSYFQSIDTPANQRFVENFRAYCGANSVTSDPIEAAYTQIYLWKQSVETAQSFQVNKVRQAAYGQTYAAPGGLIKIATNHHVWKACRVGQYCGDGQFKIVYETDAPLPPLPWLGVEKKDGSRSNTVIKLLEEVSQGIHYSWQLEQKSRQLEAALHQLQEETRQRTRLEVERQRSEIALRESEERYRSIFERAVEGIFQTTLTGEYLQVNPSLVKIYGYGSAQELIGQLQADQLYVDPNRRQEFIRLMEEQEAISNFESQVYRKDGEVIWIAEHVRLIRDAEGDPQYYEGTVQDITERKRTELALADANQQITRLNEQLQEENLRLGAELEITRRLQKMILPKEEELQAIPNLDIAGFMEPATEVGGDYYDVLQHNGRIKIGIGDVTGHGLESGLMMLMAQTAVRALLTVEENNPVAYLNAINQILYKNARRMRSGKNMTLSLLDYEPLANSGRLRLSGQHEELIIVRSNGEIEQIDTLDLGFPLGLEFDISGFIAQAEVELHPGDLAVLYTDGVTEAFNCQNQPYGLERLRQVLQENRGHSAAEIQRIVVEDLLNYVGEQKVHDDITLLIIKQKDR